MDSARHRRAEADAVIGAGHIVVHRFRDRYDFQSFLVEANAITQGVIAANRDEKIDAQPFQILQHFGSEIVFVGGIFVFEMRWNTGFLDAGRVGSGAMEKGATRTSGAIDNFFREELIVVAVVVILLANNVDQSCPATANPDYLITLANGTYGDGTYRRIEAWDVTSAGQNADHPFARVDTGHDCRFA